MIALSTDKAANPINLYGASKLASDKIFVAANNLAGADGTRFRGRALRQCRGLARQRGAVLPEADRRRRPKALPITDPRMTRFWITLTRASTSCSRALEMMRGGEIFVPKIP